MHTCRGLRVFGMCCAVLGSCASRSTLAWRQAVCEARCCSSCATPCNCRCVACTLCASPLSRCMRVWRGRCCGSVSSLSRKRSELDLKGPVGLMGGRDNRLPPPVWPSLSKNDMRRRIGLTCWRPTRRSRWVTKLEDFRLPATAHTSPTPPAVSATFRVLKLSPCDAQDRCEQHDTA